MADPSPAPGRASARFLNPATMHRPTGYTHVVEVTAGRPVNIAGQMALDPAGTLVGQGDVRAQARQVFENLRGALEAVGAGFGQVVKLTVYLVDAAHLPAVREVRDQYVDTARPPASTAVQVGRLVLDDLLLEVEAVAVVDAWNSRSQPTASASRSTWSRSATVGSKISSSTPSASKAAARSRTAAGVRAAPAATPSAQSPRKP
jgi:enamine deaminase RidA (YjgF/YER057c/UK114 family)